MIILEFTFLSEKLGDRLIFLIAKEPFGIYHKGLI